MTIVYLDQNQWISLARAYHGKGHDSRLTEALAALKQAVQAESISLPLSAIHYMETARVLRPGPRVRLGSVMWELSRGLTIASYRSILTYELESALAKRLPQLHPRPFTLVSRGVAHAFGMEVRPFRIRDDLRAAMPLSIVTQLEETGNTLMQRVLVTGEAPPGVGMLTFGITEHNRRHSGPAE